MQTKRNTISSRGFTLLIAAILSSLALSVGVALAHVSSKQLALSAAAQDSTIAFYAASSALECVTTADQISYLPEGGRGSAFAGDVYTIEIPCYIGEGWGTIRLYHQYDDDNVGRVFASGDWTDEYGNWHGDSWFSMRGGCAHLTVAKRYDGQAYLYARGTNTCDFSDPERVVERGLSASY